MNDTLHPAARGFSQGDLPEQRPGIVGTLMQDRDALLSRLTDIDLVPMLLVYTHLSGRADMLDKLAPFIKGPWSFEVEVPAALQEELRHALVTVLEQHRAEGRPLPGAPPTGLLHRMLDVAVGQHVPNEYIPLAEQEMDFAADDPWTVPWRRRPPAAELERFQVVVIGAGFSGIAMGAKLREAGIPFVVIEKNDQPGGTWYENSYPGCGVDTPNHFYSYSGRLEANWNFYFAKRDEIFSYLQTAFRDAGIAGNVRFSQEVANTRWDPASNLWIVEVRRQDGSTYTIRANAVVSATGLLNRPAYPDIPGIDEFKGPMFHSARWDHSVDLTGKRVAMIGTGASGMQIGPSIAPAVGQLTIFQRSPHWAMRNPLYFQAVHGNVKWALANLPYYAKWFRLLLLWASSDIFFDTLRIDPDWTEPASSLNARNAETRRRLVAHITAEVGGDAELLEKVVPAYPPYGKRMLRDNNWYRSLTRDNVELVTGPVQRFTCNGVVDSAGREHPFDAIILATGFKAQQPLWPIEVVGRNGSVRDAWGEDNPRAHLGITIPDFPNLFMIYGPNTNGGHGGSAVFHSECQIRYIMQALRELLERGAAAMEVRPEPFDAYNARVDAEHRQLVWSHPGVRNWYRNKAGRVVANSPWRIVDYWNLTSRLDVESYVFSGKEPSVV